jgi:hypothetical protein
VRHALSHALRYLTGVRSLIFNAAMTERRFWQLEAERAVPQSGQPQLDRLSVQADPQRSSAADAIGDHAPSCRSNLASSKKEL